MTDVMKFTLAPRPVEGRDVTKSQCQHGIMAVVPGDAERVPVAHYCHYRGDILHEHHYCGCGYAWMSDGLRLDQPGT